MNLERAGYDVRGIDSNRELVRRITEGTFQTVEPDVEAALRTARNFQVAGYLGAIHEFDPAVVFIAVDTPTVVNGYDHSRVDRVLSDLFALGASRDRIELALVCTTMPGYCDLKAGEAASHGYFLSYTPAFVAQGSILHDQQFPDQVLIGEADHAAGECLKRVYRRVCRNEPAVHRMSPLSAEIAKLATNCALTMKIAFANAIGDLATRVCAEPEKILAAVGADTRIGGQFLRYGFGYGGPCFPRDSRALNFFAKQHGCELLQAAATDEMNRRHRAFQVEHYLRTHREDEPIHFFSVTYKPGTDICEESQPLAVAVELARAGRTVVIHEGPVVLARLRSEFGDLFVYRDRLADTATA